MKSMALAGIAAASIALTLPQPAEAQTRETRWDYGPGQVQHHRARPRPQAQRPRAVAPPTRFVAPHHQGPRRGASARHYQRFHPHAGYRIGPAPRGHHYRRHGNHVVLVNDRSLQVVALIGLLAALMY